MLCDILRFFPFTRDGVTVEHANKGEQIDIPDGIAPGLASEGFIQPVAKAELRAEPKPAKPPKASADKPAA